MASAVGVDVGVVKLSVDLCRGEWGDSSLNIVPMLSAVGVVLSGVVSGVDSSCGCGGRGIGALSVGRAMTESTTATVWRSTQGR